MRTEYDRIARIPDYALSYLINGDDSRLSPEDKKIIDQWKLTYETMAKEANGYFELSQENPEENVDSYFTWNPEFGLACNVYDYHILILVN